MSHTTARCMPRMAIVLMTVTLSVLADGVSHSDAHQDPCYRLHSCPSDHGTYVCGDKGRCDQCPDNQYCLAGKPRVASSVKPTPAPPSPSPSTTTTPSPVTVDSVGSVKNARQNRLADLGQTLSA
jgi:hypothetical protein